MTILLWDLKGTRYNLYVNGGYGFLNSVPQNRTHSLDIKFCRPSDLTVNSENNVIVVNKTWFLLASELVFSWFTQSENTINTHVLFTTTTLYSKLLTILFTQTSPSYHKKGDRNWALDCTYVIDEREKNIRYVLHKLGRNSLHAGRYWEAWTLIINCTSVYIKAGLTCSSTFWKT